MTGPYSLADVTPPVGRQRSLASITLSIAASTESADLAEVGALCFWPTLTPTAVPNVHSLRYSPCPFQRRSPAPQSIADGRVERGHVRRLQQSQFSRAQLRTGCDGPRSDRSCNRVRDRHKNLNLDVSWFADHIPTAEHIAMFCWEQLASQLPAGTLANVRLWETPRNYVDYDGGT